MKVLIMANKCIAGELDPTQFITVYIYVIDVVVIIVIVLIPLSTVKLEE